MKCNQVMCTILGSVLCCLPAAAQEKGYWRAASSTAQSITGDVTLSADKIALTFSSFPIAQIRVLEPGELSAVFEAESGAGGSGSLYRLSIPGTKVFQHKNTLCGSEQTQWMATYVSGRELHLAFFSGSKMPVLTPDGIANSTDLCGTFLYAR
jgi:hypothetical protein